jgi:hypothetical protein
MSRRSFWKCLRVPAFAAAATGCFDPRQTELIAQGQDALVWGGEQELTAGDAAEFDQFGYSVSLGDDRALVGAYGDDSYRGAAYVFASNNGRWTEEQKLGAEDGAEADSFGWSVALDGDRALLGAYGSEFYRGAAYIFVRSGGSWVEEQKLVASDGARGDNFGWSVALEGDRALVGAFAKDSSKGAAYVFVRRGSSWTQDAELIASDPSEKDQFGYSVALAGDRALVGAPGKDADRGAGHVFVRDGSSWVEEQKLVASDGAGSSQGGLVSGDHLGVSVALAGERALLGAYDHGDLQGAAYVFVQGDGTWTEEQKLVASDGAVGARFGGATSLRSDRALVGAFASSSARGAAYVFLRNDSAWSEEQILTASDGLDMDLFGWSVSLGADRALVGAQSVDNLRGATYGYSLGLENGGHCTADADCASGHCFEERCCETADCSPCQANGDCPESRYCAGDQTCRPRNTTSPELNGYFCATGETCASGYCVDGVCCDHPCDDTCEACTAALKGEGADGLCGALADGMSPECAHASEPIARGGGCSSWP